MGQKGLDARILKRLTGVDLARTCKFLLNDCFVPEQGFYSQYRGKGTISCATTAICIYALSEIGLLTPQQKANFERVLLGFRLSGQADRAGAFPRTTGSAPTSWATAQAVLALLSLGAEWTAVQESVNWLPKRAGNRWRLELSGH